MTTQIDKNRLDIEHVRQQMQWQPWIALATLLAAVAALSGVILGLAHLLR